MITWRVLIVGSWHRLRRSMQHQHGTDRRLSIDLGALNVPASEASAAGGRRRERFAGRLTDGRDRPSRPRGPHLASRDPSLRGREFTHRCNGNSRETVTATWAVACRGQQRGSTLVNLMRPEVSHGCAISINPEDQGFFCPLSSCQVWAGLLVTARLCGHTWHVRSHASRASFGHAIGHNSRKNHGRRERRPGQQSR